MYLIIGNGRLAKHFCYYFNLLQIKYYQYQRIDNIESLYRKLTLATHVLLLINDDAIDRFIEDNLLDFLDKKIIIHCSGALVSKYAYSVHPLMTFSQYLYDIDTYRNIPFICEKRNLEFAQLLPNLNNKFYYIEPENKAYYHAMCVIANNFTTILWQAVKKRMKEKVGVDFSAMEIILKQTMQNIGDNIDDALTGPLIRKDEKTINKHLAVLNSDLISTLYKAFDKFYREEHYKER